VVITVGYDLVEHAPANWNPKRDKRIICIDTVAPEVDEHFMTEVDLVGDLSYIITWLAEALPALSTIEDSRLNEIVLGRFEAAKDDDAFPMQPPRVLWEIRQALGRRDILISDVGLHKLWIARMFPAHEPETVFIANGLAGMGIALPTGIAAKLVHPDRHVVTVSGDGGFLMNVQELETAVRLRTPLVNIIWENRQYGSIVWKQDKKFGRHFGTDFTNPDFVRLADAFGMPAWRCDAVEDLGRHLRHALSLDLPSLIVVPIDYSIDVSISEELGTETVAA
jgi:acetolactate synthase-1/2/3 large subunit